MKKFWTIALLVCSVCAYSQSVESVLNTFFDKIEKQVLVADYTITLTDGITQPLAYQGSVKMKGERFVIDVSDMQIAYDGKTLYTYMDGMDELTLSTPTEEELLSANPLLYAKAIRSVSTIAFAKIKAEGYYIIDVTPKDQTAGIEKFVLKLRKSDYMPVSVTLRESKNKTTLLTLKNPKYTTAVPTFSITVAGAAINDIR